MCRRHWADELHDRFLAYTVLRPSAWHVEIVFVADHGVREDVAPMWCGAMNAIVASRVDSGRVERVKIFLDARNAPWRELTLNAQMELKAYC
jgi:hypothetical protein